MHKDQWFLESAKPQCKDSPTKKCVRTNVFMCFCKSFHANAVTCLSNHITWAVINMIYSKIITPSFISRRAWSRTMFGLLDRGACWKNLQPSPHQPSTNGGLTWNYINMHLGEGNQMGTAQSDSTLEGLKSKRKQQSCHKLALRNCNTTSLITGEV